MLKYFLKLFKYLERSEYKNSSTFWASICTIYFCFTILSSYVSSSSNNQFESQARLVVEDVRGGGSDKRPNLLQKIGSFFNPGQYKQRSAQRSASRTESPNPGIPEAGKEVTNSVDNLAKKKYFKKMLVKHFPDFESRVSMEKRQAVIYHKALKKIRGYQRISPLLENHQKWLTTEEKLSIDYFHGTEIYTKLQDPKTSPNIFDTRKSFLKKMEDQDMREKFLETYNRVNSIE